MTFTDLFGAKKPLIGVLHLLALPGAPLYDGAMQKVYDQALLELEIFKRNAIDSGADLRAEGHAASNVGMTRSFR